MNSMRKQIALVNQPESIAEALDFLQNALSELQLSTRKINSAMLSAEELIVKMLSSSAKGKLHISVDSLLGSVYIRISAPGESFSLETTGVMTEDIMDDAWAPEAEMAIRSMILNARRNEIRLRHRLGVNTAILTVKKSEHANLILTVSSLAAGLLFGLLLRLLTPAGFSNWISENIFSLISSLYMNAIMMLVAPLVFFSMASCISQFTDLRSLGRLGAKVMGFYQVTTMIAITLGFGVFQVFQPGNPALLNAIVQESDTAQTVSVSIRETILNIVPNNFAGAFLNADMIQLIVMGILLGSCVSGLGKYSESVQNMLDAMNELFSRAITLVVKIMPFIIFCSMANLMLTMETSSMMSLLGIAGSCYLFAVLMLCVYGLLLLTIGRLNPLPFFRHFFPVMVTALSLSSSSAVMPTSMKTLDQKMGVSRKIYSFSIPLGTTINMDGTSFLLIVTTLAMGKVVGVSFGGNQLFSLILTVILLSLGSPGVPGAAIICQAMLLRQFGIPVELASLLFGIIALIDPILTLVNVTGDAAVTTMVAKSEGLLNLETYNI